MCRVLRLWVSRNSTVSIREQLSAQLVLGIVSGRLAPGERLPSVRALARRLRIHPNTVSAAYSDLASRGWVGRRGSGVFVSLRRLSPRAETEVGDLNGFVRQFVEEGLRFGYSVESMQLAFAAVTRPSIAALVVADTDLELARVLATEVGDALGMEVRASELEKFLFKPGDCLLGLAANEAILRSAAGADGYRTLKFKSMEELVSGYRRSGDGLSRCSLHWDLERRLSCGESRPKAIGPMGSSGAGLWPPMRFPPEIALPR